MSLQERIEADKATRVGTKGVRIDDETHRKLVELAELYEVPISKFVKYMTDDCYEEHE